MSLDQATLAKVILELDEASLNLERQGLPYDHPITSALRKVNRASRMLRERTEDIEALIRQHAANGLSKKDAIQALRISRYRFCLLIEAMPDIKWANPHNSESRKRYNESLKGTPASAERQRNLDRGREVMVSNKRVHECRGVRGTVLELVEHFGDEVKVGYSSVTERMRSGMTLEQALFTPRRPSAVDRCAKTAAHRKQYRSHHAHFGSLSQQENRP